MHSPRTASAMRPSSPLSPRFDSSARYQTLQPPSSRPFSPRGSTTQQQRRQHASHLALPGLPRFHPANFLPAHSSASSTPGSGPTSPSLSLSPQMQQKLYMDAQKQYQQDAFPRPSSQGSLRQKPDGPRLVPLGSPGPVTPLELEEEDDYLAAGSRSTSRHMNLQHGDELATKLTHIACQSERPSRPSLGSLTST